MSAPSRNRRRINSSKELVEWLRLANAGGTAGNDYALATVTSYQTGGVRVAFDGDIDDSGNPIETAVTFVCLGVAPGVGNRVLMLKIGATWMVLGPINTLLPERVHWNRSANIAANAYVDVGQPPANDYMTSTLISLNSANATQLTMSVDCHLDLVITGSAPAVSGQTVSGFATSQNGARPTTAGTQQQGGSVFQFIWNYSAFVQAGDVFVLQHRNGNVSAIWNFNSIFSAYPQEMNVIGGA